MITQLASKASYLSQNNKDYVIYTSDETFCAIYRIQYPNKIRKIFFAPPSIFLSETEIHYFYIYQM